MIKLPRFQGFLELIFGVNDDARSVLSSFIFALTPKLRRVVPFPEHAQEIAKVDLVRFIDDAHDLGVIGEAGADFVVSRVDRRAAGETHLSGVHAHDLPELALCVL